MPYKTVWRNGIPMTEWVPDKPGRPRTARPPAVPKWAAGVKPGTVAGTPGYKQPAYGPTAPWQNVTGLGGGYRFDPEIETGLELEPLTEGPWTKTPAGNFGPWGPSGPAGPYKPGTTTPGADGTPDAGSTPAVTGPPGDVGWVNIRRNAPDYRGILNQYTTDWKARLNAGLGAMEAQRLGRARSAINRLGVRGDRQALLGKIGRFGLTEEDLRLAEENPWSELRGIEQQATEARGQSQAEFAARGGFRSGGTARAMERIEDARARNEAMATEETMSGLNQDLFSAAEWERQQRDELDQRAANMEMQLAQAYQPYDVQAYWDPNAGGYRYGDQVYDQYGRLIG